MQIKNSKILITGGSLGIGKITAKLLVENGAEVLITGRNEERLQKAATDTGAKYLLADVSQESDITRTFEWVAENWGSFDCLINNAGIGEFPTLDEISMDTFQKIYTVNVFGLALMTQQAARIFKAQNYGHIINIASTAATRGFERGTIYASSKFALRGMTECWQAELRKHNIRVILINPSEVTTAFFNEERQERDDLPNKLRPDEIAHTIKAALEMDDRGFIKELTVFATNPF